MKLVEINNKKYSKLICGTNAVYGRSHFSDAKDMEYKKYFSGDNIERMFSRCIELGVNTIETSANEKIYETIRKFKNNNINFNAVGSTRIDETSGMKTHYVKLAFLIENKSEICIIHSQFVDRPGSREDIKGLMKMSDQIHEAGLLTGISTHNVETVILCEKNNYNIDVYLFPLNITGFVYPGFKGNDTNKERIDLIMNTPKTFIIMKVLAAGRIPPDEGIQFVSENMKPDDLLSIGFGNLFELEECVKYCEKYFA